MIAGFERSGKDGRVEEGHAKEEEDDEEEGEMLKEEVESPEPVEQGYEKGKDSHDGTACRAGGGVSTSGRPQLLAYARCGRREAGLQTVWKKKWEREEEKI